MERVMIIGCGGAGKSTLARQLGEVTGLPVVHLDKLFWKSGWVESSKAEIDEKIRQAAACPRWIMDGNYNRTLEQRLERADTVIYLDFPRMVCLWGVFKRLLTNLGKVRPDMPEGCPEKVDLEFLRWIWNFNKACMNTMATITMSAPTACWQPGAFMCLRKRPMVWCLLVNTSLVLMAR